MLAILTAVHFPLRFVNQFIDARDPKRGGAFIDPTIWPFVIDHLPSGFDFPFQFCQTGNHQKVSDIAPCVPLWHAQFFDVHLAFPVYGCCR